MITQDLLVLMVAVNILSRLQENENKHIMLPGFNHVGINGLWEFDIMNTPSENRFQFVHH